MSSSDLLSRDTSPTGRAVAVAVAILALASSGCDALLDVEAPGRVPEEALRQPSNASQLVESVRADFSCAFVEFAVATGLIGDELKDSQLGADLWDYDRRTVTADSEYAPWTCADFDPGIYQTLTSARFQAENAQKILSGFSDDEVAGDRTAFLGTSNALAGYSRLLLGEAMCRAGSLVEGEDGFEAGPAVTSEELFTSAQQDFTDAIEQAETSEADSVLYLARLGRARARLNSGDEQGALEDATQVPASFEWMAPTSSQSYRSSNRAWTMNNRDEAITVEADFRGVTFDGVSDPRVPVLDAGRVAAGDDETPLFIQQKYGSQATPVPVATGDEARLIVAEVEGGQTAVDIINEFHQRAGLPAWQPDNPSEADIQGHVYEERRRELFLESQHFYTKLRFIEKAAELGVSPAELNPNLPPSPPAGEPFPVRGGFYGELECLPLPNIEAENNPNISN